MIQGAVESLQDVLLGKFSSEETEIKQQTQKLLEIYLEKIEEPLRQFQSVAKEVFSLPENVILPGFEEEEHATLEDIEDLKKQVEDLRKEYLEEVCYKAYLEKKNGEFEKVKSLFDKVNEVLKCCKDSEAQQGEKSLEELFETVKTCKELYLMKRKEVEGRHKEEN